MTGDVKCTVMYIQQHDYTTYYNLCTALFIELILKKCLEHQQSLHQPCLWIHTCGYIPVHLAHVCTDVSVFAHVHPRVLSVSSQG